MLNFLEKNKDTLKSDVVELLCESENKVGHSVDYGYTVYIYVDIFPKIKHGRKKENFS